MQNGHFVDLCVLEDSILAIFYSEHANTLLGLLLRHHLGANLHTSKQSYNIHKNNKKARNGRVLNAKTNEERISHLDENIVDAVRRNPSNAALNNN